MTLFCLVKVPEEVTSCPCCSTALDKDAVEALPALHDLVEQTTRLADLEAVSVLIAQKIEQLKAANSQEAGNVGSESS